MALRTGFGKQAASHLVIAASGRAKSQFVAIVAASGIALAFTGIYIYLMVNQRDTREVMTFIGMAFGLLVGLATGRKSD
jgi:hypothetical protein